MFIIVVALDGENQKLSIFVIGILVDFKTQKLEKSLNMTDNP